MTTAPLMKISLCPYCHFARFLVAIVRRVTADKLEILDKFSRGV
jgi:hypothetical protein